jgi:quercetin dioxygenase-like cupin family protein
MIEVVRWTKSKKPTLEELKKHLAMMGRESELYSDLPGIKYGRHKHPFEDFVLIVSGKMKIITDNGEWTLKPGDRVDLPANTIHAAAVIGREEVKYLSAAK